MEREFNILITFQRDPKTYEFTSFKIQLPEWVVELDAKKLREIRELWGSQAETRFAQSQCRHYLWLLSAMLDAGHPGVRFTYREELKGLRP